MKSIFRATAILSGSSVITILVGLVSAKLMAVLLQPAGYGYYGLIQSLVAVATLLTGMGLATGLVRQGASAASRNDEEAITSLRNGAWALFWAMGVVSMAALILLRGPLSRLCGVNQSNPFTIPMIGLAILFTIGTNIQTGMLNMYHRVEALGTYAVVNSVVCSAVAVAAVLIWHVRGVLVAVVVGAVASWSVSKIMLHRHVGGSVTRFFRKETLAAAWSLAQFGGPFTVSTMVGTGVQLALPIVIFHLLGTESVGYYKASAAVAVGYLGFLVTAMGQDYFPRLSAVKDDPKALVELINEQHRLVMLLSIPIILVTLALVPYLIPLVYSRKFYPAVAILEWQLIGDIFKFSSWTMSYAILARCKTSIYFFTESIGGVTTLITTWLGVRLFGLPGLGIASLLMFVIYYGLTWVVIRREVPLVWTASNKKMLALAVLAAAIIRALPSTRFGAFRTPVALALAAAATIFSGVVLYRQYLKGKGPDQVVALANTSEQETVSIV